MSKCEKADYAPAIYGHSCMLDRHPRNIPHHCECGHKWLEPKEPVEKPRTVSGRLEL